MTAEPQVVVMMLDAQMPQIAAALHGSLESILSAAQKTQTGKAPFQGASLTAFWVQSVLSTAQRSNRYILDSLKLQIAAGLHGSLESVL